MSEFDKATRYPDIFEQEGPRLGNQFTEDSFLVAYLQRVLPAEVFQSVSPDLEKLGHRVVTDLWDAHLECHDNPPTLKNYDAFGRRVDEIETCNAWKKLHRFSAEEGLISLGYAREHGQYSRLHQFAKLYLFNPSSAIFTCPLAMTDGAARLMEKLDMKNPSDCEGAFAHLTSRDGNKFWTSGQWMTERKGGSDVGDGTQTLAYPCDDGSYRLYGLKWFTSATTSEMTITLARIVDSSGKPVPGSRGLSCFFLRVRDDEGRLNGIEVRRLKNKLGTRALPTAELELKGARATLLSKPGRGVAVISTLLNITRVYNATSAIAIMRRLLALARDYAHRRHVFGDTLSNKPAHVETLSQMEVTFRASFCMTFDAVALIGKVEVGGEQEKDSELLLRVLTPLAKLFTAKECVAMVSEGLETFGGQGYMEDTHLGGFLREAQVLPIWEGTTNVLSLDVLRAVAKSRGKVLEVFFAVVQARMQEARERNARAAGEVLSSMTEAIGVVQDFCTRVLLSKTTSHTLLESCARPLALSLAKLYAASSLLEHAAWSDSQSDWEVCSRFVGENAFPLCDTRLTRVAAQSDRLEQSSTLALDKDASGTPRGCGNDTTRRSML